MNPSTALATVVVDELVRGGVREAVLAPGSRSAPLAFALRQADADGGLRLHVRIDERSAGFLALGLAKRRHRPVAVVTTSGTAVANLHPAVVEADAAGVPLLVLSADRPPELRGVGANQTIDQVKLFGPAVRFFHELGPADERPGQNAYWRGTVSRALAAAADGPVHLNLPLREPLVPDGSPDWFEALGGRPDGEAWTTVERERHRPQTVLHVPARTLVVVGDADDTQVDEALDAAQQLGLPVVAEPTVGRATRNVLRSGPALIGVDAWLGKHQPDHALIVGRPTLGRDLARLTGRAGVAVTVVDRRSRWSDPQHRAGLVRTAVGPWMSEDAEHRSGPEWLETWLAADRAARSAVDAVLDDEWPSGPRLARDLMTLLPEQSLLMVGSSASVRDLWLGAVPRTDVHVYANRGVAGIDGTISTAVGLALDGGHDSGDGRAFALMGDLTFLHDANGLVIGPDEPRPDLTIVVNNDDGGGIFGQLEPGAPENAEAFERLFGTPHGVDVAALCAATRTPYVLVTSLDELSAAVTCGPGIRVVEVRTDRRRRRDLDRRLAAAVADAVGR